MSIPITNESWEEKYFELENRYKKETQELRELVIRLELKLEELEITTIYFGR